MEKETEEPSRCIPGMAPSKYPYRRRGTSWLPGTDIFVLDGDGKRIQLTKKVVKDKDGKEQATNQLDLDGLNKKIGLFTCDNPEGLVHMGNNRYRSGEFSGQWTAVKEQTNSNRIVSEPLNCPAPSSLRKW